jgi:hypothetical protein
MGYITEHLFHLWSETFCWNWLKNPAFQPHSEGGGVLEDRAVHNVGEVLFRATFILHPPNSFCLTPAKELNEVKKKKKKKKHKTRLSLSNYNYAVKFYFVRHFIRT